jgi:uncharacterized protein YkwD
MRWFVAAFVLLAACSTEEDPNELTGTPLLHHRTNGAKAIRADETLGDDDDDDSTTTTTTSSSGSGTDSTTTTGGTSSAASVKKSIAQQCFEIINKYRAKTNLPPLQEWTAEETCATGQAKSDSETNSAHGAFTQCGEMAQNECPGYPSPATDQLPECLADMYAEGPGGGHYENMTSTQYTKVACNVYQLADGSFWSVQDFK